MKHFFLGNITRTISLIILLAFLPSIIITVMFGLQKNNHETIAAEQQLREEISHLNSEVLLIFDRTRNALSIIAALPQIRDMQAEQIKPVLTGMLRTERNEWSNLLLISLTDKSIVAAKGNPPSSVNLDPLVRKTIATVQQTKKFSVSALVKDPLTNDDVLYAAQPILDQHGQAEAILLAGILVDTFRSHVADKLFLPNASIYLSDYKGQVIFSNTISDYSSPQALPDQFYSLLCKESKQIGFTLLNENTRKQSAVAYSRIQRVRPDKGLPTAEDSSTYLPISTDWLLGSVINLQFKYIHAASITNLVHQLLWLTTAMLAGLAIASFMAQQYLSKPIYALTKTIQKVGQGNFEAVQELPKTSGAIEELYETFRTMNKDLALHAQELLQAKKAADEASKTKTSFLANMSHEIRTPMNAIIGMAYLALKTNLTNQQKGYLQKIHIAALSLLGIINDILDFSKIEANKLHIEEAPFKLDDVFATVATYTAQKAEEKNIELIFAISPGVPKTLIGDPLRIGQILTNITTNAIKFTQRGEIVLSCTLVKEQNSTQYVDKTPNQEKKIRLRFTATDTGIGMGKEQLDRLFAPFTQADTSTTRQYGGTGLGLSITKHLVEMMNGTIVINSVENQGTIVDIELEATVPNAELEVKKSPASLENTRILIIDDNETARRILSEMLQQFNTRPTAVASAQDAYALLEEARTNDPFQLVLLDWSMPDVSGVEAAEHIHSMHLPVQPPLILITAFGQTDPLDLAEYTGLSGILHKPISPSQLFDSLLTALQSNLLNDIQEGDYAEQLNLPYSFEGVSILLVEDNLINQQVAQEILQEQGIKVTIASNGQEAISVMTQRPKDFHLILMDLQMPVMDGHEATRLLRQDSRFAVVPIIAMTAHAMNTEYDACLQSGMNDHIAKPIEISKLFSVLAKWLPNQVIKTKLNELELPDMYRPASAKTDLPDNLGSSSVLSAVETVGENRLRNQLNRKESIMTEPSRPIPPFTQVPEIPCLDTRNAIARLGENPKLYIKTINLFAEKLPQYVQELANAVAAQDVEAIKRNAHTIKGLAATVGASALADAALELEHCAAKQEINQGLHSKTQEAARELLDALRTSASNTPPNGDLPTDSTLQTKIHQLETLLQNNDPAARIYFKQHADFFATHLPRGAFSAIKTTLDAFDFQGTLAALRQI